MRTSEWKLKRLGYPEEIVLSGQEEFPLGRSKDSYHAILSLCVSRRHCIFRISENGLTVKDLNSANGTFVNENKIPPMIEYSLKNNDTIGIGVPINSGPDSFVFMLVKNEEKLTGNAFNVTVKNEPTEDKNKSSIDDDVVLIEEKEGIDIIDLSECIKDENDKASRNNATVFSSLPSGSGLGASSVDLNTTSVHISAFSKTIHNKEMPIAVLKQSIQKQETGSKLETEPCQKINLKTEISNLINPDCEMINRDVHNESVPNLEIKKERDACFVQKCASEHKTRTVGSGFGQCAVKEEKSHSCRQNNVELNSVGSKLNDKISNIPKYLDTSSLIKKENEKKSTVDTNIENVRKNKIEAAKLNNNEIYGERQCVSFSKEMNKSEQPRNLETSSEILRDKQIKKEILDDHNRSELKTTSSEILKQREKIGSTSISKEIDGREIGLKRPHEESSSSSNKSTSNSLTSKKAKLDSYLNTEPNSSSSSSCSYRKSSSLDSPSQSNSENENPDKWFATFSKPFLDQLENTRPIVETSILSSLSIDPKGGKSVVQDESKTMKTCAEKSKYGDREHESKTIKTCAEKSKYGDNEHELCIKKCPMVVLHKIDDLINKEQKKKPSEREIQCSAEGPLKKKTCKIPVNTLISISSSSEDHSRGSDSEVDSENHFPAIINYSQSDDVIVIDDDDDDDNENKDYKSDNLEKKITNDLCHQNEDVEVSKIACEEIRVKEEIFDDEEDVPQEEEEEDDEIFNWVCKLSQSLSPSKEEYRSPCPPTRLKKRIYILSDSSDEELPLPFEKDNANEVNIHKEIESAVDSSDKVINNLSLKSSNKNEEDNKCAKLETDPKNVCNNLEKTAPIKSTVSRNEKIINQPSTRKIALLDCALPMKVKSHRRRTKSIEKNKTTDIVEQSSKEEQNNITHMGKNSKDKFNEIEDTKTSSSLNNNLLSDKNQVKEDRKAKLKALTAQKCEVTTLEKIESKAPPKSTYRPKNTLLSRADKLAESLATSNVSCKQKKEKIKVKVVRKKNEDVLQGSSVSSSVSSRNRQVSSQVRDSSNDESITSKSINNIPDSTSSKRPQVLQANSSVSEIERQVKKLSFKDLPKIPKHKTSESSSSKSHTNVTEESKKLTKGKLPLCSSLKLNSAHSKKQVSFASEKNLCAINTFVIEPGNTLHRIEGKDAPIKKTLADQAEVLYDSSKMVLKRVITLILNFWNPRWIIEESIISENGGEPPPAHCQNVIVSALYPMLTSFSNYDEYLKIVEPLMLLDLWAQVSEDCRRPNERTRAKYVISVNEIKDAKDTNGIISLHCSMLISFKQDREKRHPHVGDLCVIRYPVMSSSNVPQEENNTKTSQQDKLYERFAYVESLTRDYFRSGNWSQGNPSADPPHCKFNFIIKMKGDLNLTLIHPTLKIISSIRSDLRSFEAIGFLKHTKLCKMILNPCVADYKLSNIKVNSRLVTQDPLNETQKNAVLTCAAACLSRTPKLCLIQGPPGTGKTKVIVNIIRQILYGNDQYSKQRWDKKTRILLCAPSNTAADELVERLLVVRSELPKETRFKMVRAGPIEFLREKVRGVSLDELAKKDMDAALAHQMYSLESVELEISTLEARRRSYVMAYEHATVKKLNTGMYEKKIKEVEKRITELKGPLKNVPGTKSAEMEREARKKILSFADIVVSTLSSSFNSQMTEVFASRNGRSTARFTCCIIDEATQCKEPECLIPLMYGIEKIIMVGDPEQLPATVISQVAKGKSFGQSLFNRIWNKFQNEAENPVIFLNTQYRMHPEIYKWPNEYIYNCKVFSHRSVHYSTPLKPYCVLAHRFQQNGQSLVNSSEALLVTEIANTLALQFPVLLKTIGIITPYQKQLQEIKNHVGESASSVTILVNTIDGFQGRECDVIIFSCVRTRGVGFMGDSQRLNVALTRARVSLIICGNFVSLQDDIMWSNLLADALKRNLIIDINNKSIDPRHLLEYFVRR